MDNKKIVAVSGYFDPIHIGHLEYFKFAKELGDYLYVIVNNDNQAKLKKGSFFMTESDRFKIVESMDIVDKAILSIDQDKSVSKTLLKIKPDIFANGGDKFEGSILEEKVLNYRSIGHLIAFDFESTEKRDMFAQQCFERNLLCNKTAEKTIRLRPNLAITEEEINHFENIVKQSI